MGAARYNFIVIDDSKLDCFIAEKIIRNTGLANDVHTFMSARDALAHISNLDLDNPEEKFILLVDIQMPIMNGFQFIEAFEQAVTEEARSRFFCVNLLTSSINESDFSKASGYASVHKFLNKPISKTVLIDLVSDCFVI